MLNAILETILLDHPSNIEDLTWNTMQVFTLIGGVLGVAGSFFANKYAIEQLRAGKAALKAQTEKDIQELKKDISDQEDLMHKRVDAVNKKLADSEKIIGDKLDGIKEEIKGVEIKIGENHNALLTALLKRKE